MSWRTIDRMTMLWPTRFGNLPCAAAEVCALHATVALIIVFGGCAPQSQPPRQPATSLARSEDNVAPPCAAQSLGPRRPEQFAASDSASVSTRRPALGVPHAPGTVTNSPIPVMRGWRPLSLDDPFLRDRNGRVIGLEVTVTHVMSDMFGIKPPGLNGDRGQSDLKIAHDDVRRHPDSAAAYLGRGMVYAFALGKFDEALADFGRAIKLAPNLVPAYQYRANILQLKKDYRNSILDATAVIRLDPSNPAGYYLRAVASDATQDYKTAIDDCTVLINRLPDSTPIYLLRGNSQLSADRLDGAIADFSDVIRRGEQASSARLLALAFDNRGLAYECKEQFDKAGEDYRRATELEPEVPVFLLHRAAVYHRDGQLDAAVAVLNKAIRCGPQLSSTYVERAGVRAEGGNFTGAIDDCTNAIKNVPGAVVARFLRGIVFLKMGNEAAAQADFAEAARLKPAMAAAHASQGMLLRAAGKVDSAIVEFTAALQPSPNSMTGSVAYYYRGLCWKDKGDRTKMESDLHRARRLWRTPDQWGSKPNLKN
jgi:tetratricopeptide (TPR) repeat protein